MEIEMIVNGTKRSFKIKPYETLLEVLRKAGYKSIKFGCGEGECGACTVIMDGLNVKSCILLAAQAHGHEIETLENLKKGEKLHPLQEEFVATGGSQCGYCVPGMIMSAKRLLDDNPDPTDEDIKKGLDGNLCRCTGYVKQLEAVKNAAKRLQGESYE